MTLAHLIQRLRERPYAPSDFGQLLQQQIAFESRGRGGHRPLTQPGQAFLRPEAFRSDQAVTTEQAAKRVLTDRLAVHHTAAVFDQLPPTLDLLVGYVHRRHFVQIQQLG